MAMKGTTTAMNSTDDLDDTTDPFVFVQPVQDPYAGLNRAQRRKAMSHERKAFKNRGGRR